MKGELDAAGLRTQVLEHDAYISLPGPASLTLLADPPVDVPCITHSFAAPTAPEGLEGLVLEPRVDRRDERVAHARTRLEEVGDGTRRRRLTDQVLVVGRLEPRLAEVQRPLTHHVWNEVAGRMLTVTLTNDLDGIVYG